MLLLLGFLVFFLGSFGAHSWYLGDKKNGIIHVSLFGGGVVLSIVGTVIVANMSVVDILRGTWSVGPLLNMLGYLVIGGNSMWGLIEGIMIMSKGDSGLAAKGIPVAAPVSSQSYAGQPMSQQSMNSQYTNQLMPQSQPMPNQSADPQMMQPSDPNQSGGNWGMGNAV